MDGEKESSSSLVRGFYFFSFFFSNIHQGIIMGQLNSDSSLCKWHLTPGKELTNKGAKAKLRLTGPLIPVSELWVF